MQLGIKNPDVLAPDFRFEFPIVKLDKQVAGFLFLLNAAIQHYHGR